MPPLKKHLRVKTSRVVPSERWINAAEAIKRTASQLSPKKLVSRLSPKKKRQRPCAEEGEFDGEYQMGTVDASETHVIDASDASINDRERVPHVATPSDAPLDPFIASPSPSYAFYLHSTFPSIPAGSASCQTSVFSQYTYEAPSLACTFPVESPPGSLRCCPSTLSINSTLDASPDVPPDSFITNDEDIDPFGDVELLPGDDDELLSPAPGTFNGSGYPRPAPPAEFQSQYAGARAQPGRLREAPNATEAAQALDAINLLLHGESRGQAGGYKGPIFEGGSFVHYRILGIRAMLAFYTNRGSTTFEEWRKSAFMAAIGMGRGLHCARVLAKLTRDFVTDRSILPINPYGSWKTSMMADEDLAEDVRMYLQSLGKFITADKLREFLNRPDIKLKHGIDRDVPHSTACRYMAELGYRFTEAKKGMYVDAHERPDVVYHRDDVYLPRLAELQKRAYIFENDGTLKMDHVVGRRVIIWYHDESIFYAHDRRQKTWYHKDAEAEPYQKGEGASFMVADYFSGDFGWLKGSHGETACRTMRPGKNKDGYFTAEDIEAQAMAAVDIAQSQWPDCDHVFIYDNATTHRKREEGCLSARHMPKSRSGTRATKNKKAEDVNFLVTVNARDSDGNNMYDVKGDLIKTQIQMTGAKFADGTPQALYHPSNHPEPKIAGKFKGMKAILEERGLHDFAKLPTECTGFKCVDIQANCCCRRVLFNQPDFAAVKSILEDACAARGAEVLFLPKFHCELNPIEMCWGYAKRLYRLNPESSKEDVLERNTLNALEGVPLASMRRFVNRAHRFGDAYRRGLTGPQAAWAAKKYRGHRVLPDTIMEELDRAGLTKEV